MEIGNHQIKLLNLAKNYLEKIGSVNVDVAESAYCWLVNVPIVPGYFVLKNLQKNKIIAMPVNVLDIFFLQIKNSGVLISRSQVSGLAPKR